MTRSFRHPSRWGALLLTALLSGLPAHARVHHTESWARDRFAAAERMREALNGRPPAEQTRNDYQRVINNYRSVYLGAPTSTKADPSAVAAAETLVEMGRRFDDPKILNNAIAEYKFLRREYPGSKYRCDALFTIAEIYKDDLGQPDEARAAFQDFLHRYPNNRLVEDARRGIAELNQREKDQQAKDQQGKDQQAKGQRAQAKPQNKTAENSAKPGKAEKQNAPAKDNSRAVAAKAGANADSGDGNMAEESSQPLAEESSAERRAGRSSSNLTSSNSTSNLPPAKLPRVTGIRHWSTPDYTRVAIDLEDEVHFASQRISHPDRIFFDLRNTKLASTLVGKSFDVDDGFLKKIRVAQFQPGRTRVVLEVADLSGYNAFLLPNPYRLIIDIHGKSLAAKNVRGKSSKSSDEVSLAPDVAADPIAGTGSDKTGSDTAKSDPEMVLPTKVSSNSASSNSVSANSISAIPISPTSISPNTISRSSISQSATSRNTILPTKVSVMSVTADPVSSNLIPSNQIIERKLHATAESKPVKKIVPAADSDNADNSADPAEAATRTKTSNLRANSHRTIRDEASTDAPAFAKRDDAGSDAADDADSDVANANLPTDDSPAPASTNHRAFNKSILNSSTHKNSTQDTSTRASVGIHEAKPTAHGDRSLIRALGLKIGKIVIDAGHGGHDTGTIGPNGLQEKDLVLEVGKRLGKMLETRLGAEVVYTRKDDTFIPLETRTAIANQERADLFISIHANSSSDPDARGVETYYLNFTTSPEALEVAARENAVSEKSIYELRDLVKKITLKDKIEESREFAGDVQQSLHTGLAAKSPAIRDRGVKKAPFIVLIGANMPSILAEISFVSNPTDEHRLETAEYRQRIADSLYRGIAKYVSGLSGVKVASKIDKPAGQ